MENDQTMMSAASSFSKLERVADAQRRNLLGDGLVALVLFGGVVFGAVGIAGVAIGVDLLIHLP